MLRVPAEVLRDRVNAWFPLGAHLIQGLYRTARTIESTARQRESLVTLGTLAAGFAHEINNPAAAAARAAADLETECQTLLGSVLPAGRRRHHRRAARRARRAAPRDRAQGRRSWTPLALADLEDSAVGRGSPAAVSAVTG